MSTQPEEYIFEDRGDIQYPDPISARIKIPLEGNEHQPTVVINKVRFPRHADAFAFYLENSDKILGVRGL